MHLIEATAAPIPMVDGELALVIASILSMRALRRVVLPRFSGPLFDVGACQSTPGHLTNKGKWRQPSLRIEHGIFVLELCTWPYLLLFHKERRQDRYQS